ncbi:hypothetical protein [Clostridium hydrogeniformans]|uniref:hypothetical protein n=1 Tax=Clostridium hydrogeniformans TaxID=349933 RepID=UPI0004810544|nr:hypothetical protein [Clostridium hydrogeniformans]
MNKKIALSLFFALILSCSVGFIIYKNTKISSPPNTDEIEKSSVHASIVKIKSLKELKDSSEVIAEIEVTDKQEKRDYKGIQVDIITVKVNEVIKGDIDSKELKILQDSNTDTIIKNGEKLLIFLKKGVDNPDCYVPVGGGQGLYIIENSNNYKSINAIQNTILKPHSIENKDILKDLKGNYEDIKQKLK